MSIAYFEVSEFPPVIFPSDLDLCHSSAGRTSPAKLNKPINSVFLSFKNSLDSPIWQVSNPAIYAVFHGFVLCFAPEKYALHPTTYIDMNSDLWQPK